ncbi:DUF1223 domain-containing protein [Mucilaginibacter jinjuensis]|uniref:DUF1223 domain-containing protein n=1 Tax=Mucilaginibacter jinjuensis TaxID=1176721 RepID=A0ABY7TCZ0_9SPHI|nr:DUF1223 domain-containing protein [Mucilaginibacter jinjuensis]WCT14208.1 DUF1223 domain-containing protein [Mucilaginibacter jinjuensis]
MKKIIILLFLLCETAGASSREQKAIKNAISNDNGFVVCELFTSEGCSSCPSAEALLKKLDQEYAGTNVYLLEFHVDYWDKLGWKDKYSSPAFSKRQYAYNTALKVQAYTPQMVINGKQEMIGSEADKIHTAINQATKNSKRKTNIEYTVSAKNGEAELTYKAISFDKKDVINVALVQKEEVSEIKAGENKGRTLQHIDIVRQFVTAPISNSSGKINMEIPADLRNKALKLIVYTQNAKNLNITSATALNIGETM